MALLLIIQMLLAFFGLAFAHPTMLSHRWEMAVPRCTPTIPGTGQCQLGTGQWLNQYQASISVFDPNCNMIGFNGEAYIGEGGTFGLDSELPWVCVVELFTPDGTNVKNPTLRYAGQFQNTAECYGDGNGGTLCMTPFDC